jgi:hypothetical protein
LTLPAATDTLVGKATTDTLTNKTLTGAAMNGTVGATTPSTGAFTTLSASGTVTLNTNNTNATILINRTTTNTNGVTLFQTASVDKWIFGQRNTLDDNLYIYSFVAAGNVATFSSAGTSTTNLGLGNTAPTSSGTGITFPATQNASSDANTLDDYEEGTWTPNQGGALTVVGTFSSSGSYTKVGNLLYVRGTVSGSTSIAITSIGNISTNLPFAVKSAAASIGTVTSTNTLTTFTGCYANATTTSLLSVNTVPATTTIEFCVTYLT